MARPELWRRSTITLQRDLARMCGLSVKAFRERCKVSYSKVVEFQARGLIHLHVPIRLDGPTAQTDPPRICPSARPTSRTRSRPQPPGCTWTRPR
ncbi:MAG TPA: replication initiator [Nocardioidaceae bacterium]|nr:replication initiator [Nocardioidaceae bacterium]